MFPLSGPPPELLLPTSLRTPPTLPNMCTITSCVYTLASFSLLPSLERCCVAELLHTTEDQDFRMPLSSVTPDVENQMVDQEARRRTLRQSENGIGLDLPIAS